MTDPKKTSLYDKHIELGAKIVDFGGWAMPVSYESVLKEHEHVRSSCGCFDVSHMGEIKVTGKDARSFLNYLLINEVERIEPGQGQYTALVNEQGGMIDDLILYALGKDTYLLCVNASNTEKDFAWIESKTSDKWQVSIENVSHLYSQIAVQGPAATKVLCKIYPQHEHLLRKMPYMGISLLGEGAKSVPSYIARTGYTGEVGFELYISHEEAATIWKDLTSTPEVKPIGLGARDTLRLEACYLLYGNDMDESVSPYEAGIGWATHPSKEHFIASKPLMKEKEAGPARRTYAFKLKDPGIARSGMKVFLGDEHVGNVTSGSVLPSVGGAGGLARISSGKVKIGEEVRIEVRNKMKPAEIVKKPIYTAKTK